MKDRINHETLQWLLEPTEPGLRYLALRDLFGFSAGDPDINTAIKTAHTQGPITEVLNQMNEAGFWVQPGPGYYPKYKGTVWAVILLGQLGAKVAIDGRIGLACRYLIDHTLTDNGQFSISGTPSSTVDCLQGNLLSAFFDLGFDDPRLEKAYEWMARSLTGEGVAPLEEKNAPLRYYAGKCGPGFACGANNKLPCAWGAVKVMLAFSKIPPERRTPLIDKAIQVGVDFLFSVDPAESTYPSGWAEKPSGNWWKFGFPVFYVTDLLQNVEALVRLGYGNDPRLLRALQIIQEKQDSQGRWHLEYDYAGKTWGDFGKKKQPSKWVTLRAVWVLKNSQEFPV